MRLKEEELRVNARGDLGQRWKRSRLAGGTHTPKRGGEGGGNSLGGWLVGPRAASVAGLVWSPSPFSIFFDFSSLFFSVFI
jgi:hypothetical protein